MPRIVSLPQPGGCACGAVRYQLRAAPLLAYACHCHDCQSRSGSAFALTLVIRTADLALEGEVERIDTTSPTGRELEHVYCPSCRVRLLVRAKAALDFGSLRAGTLDDAGWVLPVVQVYAESAIPWAVIPGVRIHEDKTLDYIALAQEWRATAPAFSAS